MVEIERVHPCSVRTFGTSVSIELRLDFLSSTRGAAEARAAGARSASALPVSQSLSLGYSSSVRLGTPVSTLPTGTRHGGALPLVHNSQLRGRRVMPCANQQPRLIAYAHRRELQFLSSDGRMKMDGATRKCSAKIHPRRPPQPRTRYTSHDTRSFYCVLGVLGPLSCPAAVRRISSGGLVRVSRIVIVDPKSFTSRAY